MTINIPCDLPADIHSPSSLSSTTGCSSSADVDVPPCDAGPPTLVTSADGKSIDLSGMGPSALHHLQWEQERKFAAAIKATSKGSKDRAQIISQAYETVCTILDQISRCDDSEATLSMGMDPRYTGLVLRLLDQAERYRSSHSERTGSAVGGLFEVGFGSGLLLESASRAGHRVGGLEVAPQLLRACQRRIPTSMHANLQFGDFLQVDLGGQFNSYDIVYWNDVFEHIPTDEIDDYLERIFQLLVPGGYLITITPNWHMRPMDVTADFCPPRTEAIGFHLKEYTLGEVAGMLRHAGFDRVVTPWFVGKQSIRLSSGCLPMTALKIRLEPLLELCPYPLAVQLCRRLGMCCTLAQKPIITGA